jgi:hypothetical protein
MEMTHECSFPEEVRPNGVRVLLPCLLCRLAAADAMALAAKRLIEPDDVPRLRALIENATAEAMQSLEREDGIQPDNPRVLEESVAWGQRFLARLQ